MITIFNNLAIIKNYDICSLVECILKTGRTHQVRLHMANINSPLVGDKVYGNIKNKSFMQTVNLFYHQKEV